MDGGSPGGHATGRVGYRADGVAQEEAKDMTNGATRGRSQPFQDRRRDHSSLA